MPPASVTLTLGVAWPMLKGTAACCRPRRNPRCRRSVHDGITAGIGRGRAAQRSGSRHVVVGVREAAVAEAGERAVHARDRGARGRVGRGVVGAAGVRHAHAGRGFADAEGHGRAVGRGVIALPA